MADQDKSRRVSVNKKKSGRSSMKGKGRDMKDEEEDRENPFVFKVLSEAQVKLLMGKDVDDIQTEMVSVLELGSHETDLYEAAQLDYFVGAFWWSKEQGYSVPQISALFTAAHILMENIRDKHLPLLDNLEEFKDMFAGIPTPWSENDTSSGLDCFDIVQAKIIYDYFHQTIFQHYKMYQYVCSHTQAEEIIGLDLPVELVKPFDAPYPSPLVEGLPEEVYNKYVRTPPPTPCEVRTEEVDVKVAEDAGNERTEEHSQKEMEVLALLSPDEIRQVVNVVTQDTFKQLSNEMVAKLKEKEISVLNRINKLHKWNEEDLD